LWILSRVYRVIERRIQRIVFKKGKKERHTKSMIRRAGNRGRRNNEL
jgi:hypothetical protein